MEAIANRQAGTHHMLCVVFTGHLGHCSCQPGNPRHGGGTHPHILQGQSSLLKATGFVQLEQVQSKTLLA